MQEEAKIQEIPVKVYRTTELLMVVAPMPGLQPEDVLVEVTSGGHLILQGKLRGVLKGVKELLFNEWSVGGYYRDLALPAGVDGERATVTYGNGVIVAALPMVNHTRPARLTVTVS